MCFALACAIGDRLAAIGPVAANMPVELSLQHERPTRSISVIHIMGTADPLIPYAGGHIGNNARNPLLLSAAETVAFWVKRNQCNLVPKIKPVEDRDRSDRSQVVYMIHDGGQDGAEVVHCKIEGGGHTWPGGKTGMILGLVLGRANQDIDSGEVLWTFFKDKRKLKAFSAMPGPAGMPPAAPHGTSATRAPAKAGTPVTGEKERRSP